MNRKFAEQGGDSPISLPDEVTADQEQFVFCFLDGDRFCNASCAWFDERCISSHGTLNTCSLINVGRGLVSGLAKLARNATPANPVPPSPPPPSFGTGS